MINKLYASVTGTVSLDFRDSGVLTSIVISAQTPTAVTAQIEVSFNSTAQFQTNDATGVLASVNLPAVIGATGNLTVPLNEPIDAGERIYLHTSSGVMVSALLVSTTAGAPSRVAPRRR
jgi:hypothetical protein